MKEFLALLAVAALGLCSLARARESAVTSVTASSFKPGQPPSLAFDNNPVTAWCAAETPPPEAAFTFEGETFPDWWEVELDRATVGAIHMRSGWYDGTRIVGHKIRSFVWIYQRAGDTAWHRIDETNLYANRAQLILRFPALTGVTRLRLLSRSRDESEARVLGSNNPCLREVRLLADPNATIETTPWLAAMSTWEEGANIFDPSRHFDYSTFHVHASIARTIGRLAGHADPDTLDELWVGELGTSRAIMAEPKPAGFLLSGNYKDWDTVSPETYAGFYDFVHENRQLAWLGACGGHQLLAMAFTHPTFESFKSEFAADNMDQTVITCSTNPAYGCGGKSAKDCCYEGGFEHPFKSLAPNRPGVAMNNPWRSSRHDMLLNGLSTPFKGYLFHSDYVDPAKIAPEFDLIATYSAKVKAASRDNPAVTQAMKLKNGPVYGTQFHFDENEAGQCQRDEGHRDMDQVLTNFTLIALNRLTDKASYTLTVSSNPEAASRLTDLDRDSEWCSREPGSHGSITVAFNDPVPLRALLTVEGDSPLQARVQTTSYEWSADGKQWQHLSAQRQDPGWLTTTAGCDRTGVDDGQTRLVLFNHGPQAARFLRLNLSSPWKSVCLRELFVLRI